MSLDPAAKAQQIGKQFVELLLRQNYNGAGQLVSPAVASALSPAVLQQAWEGVLASQGALRQQLSVRSEVAGPYTAVLVACQFNQVLDLKVVVDPTFKVAGFFIVPHTDGYKAPAYANGKLFRQSELKVTTGAISLPATLTLPSGSGPFPAVVLVHGSGPQDRDESIGPNKPFRDLAQGLASNGVAVLAYDKRTRFPKQLGADLDKLTVKEETVDDALSAVTLLKGIPEIDAKRIFVLGHSLGGMLIPRIAREGSACGYVIMAGTTRPLQDVLVEQIEYIVSLSKNPSPQEQQELAKVKAQVARVNSPDLSNKTPAKDLPFNVPARYWLDLRGYDPAASAREISQPLLIIQGGRDYQVTPNGDFVRFQEALVDDKGQPKANCTFKLYPRLNHLFAEGTGKATPSEYTRPMNVSQTVIRDIADWVKAH